MSGSKDEIDSSNIRFERKLKIGVMSKNTKGILWTSIRCERIFSGYREITV